MENNIRAYTAFIEKASAHPTKNLAAYHAEMLKNFQHERFIHLIITLFFVFISLILIGVSFVLYISLPPDTFFYLLPIYAATLILTILSGFYVKHYYVLENGVQNLYKYFTKLNNIHTDC
jgi:hypothetical protein